MSEYVSICRQAVGYAIFMQYYPFIYILKNYMLDFALNGYTFVMSLACHATKKWHEKTA